MGRARVLEVLSRLLHTERRLRVRVASLAVKLLPGPILGRIEGKWSAVCSFASPVTIPGPVVAAPAAETQARTQGGEYAV